MSCKVVSMGAVVCLLGALVSGCRGEGVSSGGGSSYSSSNAASTSSPIARVPAANEMPALPEGPWRTLEQKYEALDVLKRRLDWLRGQGGREIEWQAHDDMLKELEKGIETGERARARAQSARPEMRAPTPEELEADYARARQTRRVGQIITDDLLNEPAKPGKDATPAELQAYREAMKVYKRQLGKYDLEDLVQRPVETDLPEGLVDQDVANRKAQEWIDEHSLEDERSRPPVSDRGPPVVSVEEALQELKKWQGGRGLSRALQPGAEGDYQNKSISIPESLKELLKPGPGFSAPPLRLPLYVYSLYPTRLHQSSVVCSGIPMHAQALQGGIINSIGAMELSLGEFQTASLRANSAAAAIPLIPLAALAIEGVVVGSVATEALAWATTRLAPLAASAAGLSGLATQAPALAATSSELPSGSDVAFEKWVDWAHVWVAAHSVADQSQWVSLMSPEQRAESARAKVSGARRWESERLTEFKSLLESESALILENQLSALAYGILAMDSESVDPLPAWVALEASVMEGALRMQSLGEAFLNSLPAISSFEGGLPWVLNARASAPVLAAREELGALKMSEWSGYAVGEVYLSFSNLVR